MQESEENTRLFIADWCIIRNGEMLRNNAAPIHLKDGTPQETYGLLNAPYPKFFKMDILSKWVWNGAEYLLRNPDGSFAYEGIEKTKIAVVLMTKNGSLDVDKKFQKSLETIPSPALFVYTLPNIMLGEICIRHGFQGAQSCLVSDSFDAEELVFYTSDLMIHRGMEACLCGWVDAVADATDVRLFWIARSGEIPFSASRLMQLKP